MSIIDKLRQEYSDFLPEMLKLQQYIEHNTLYKPHPELRGISETQEMKVIYKEVLQKLVEFEDSFEVYLKNSQG